MSLEINPDFYSDEYREGYLVTKKQKQIWAVELDLLNELLRVCKKHDIKVYAFAGTLLGAVRHKGFIPWDDDMDVCLTRDDYNKLLEIAEEEFEDPYFFQTALSDRKFFFGYARLRNSNTTGIIKWNESSDYNNGIYIDIFVIDGFIENRLKLMLQMMERRLITRAIYNFYSTPEETKLSRKLLNVIIRNTICKIKAYDDLVHKYEKVLSKHTKDTERLSILTHGSSFYKKYWCKKSDLKEIVYVPFENIMIPIPKNYDEMLRNMYGDYMKFPSVEERGQWHNSIIIFEPDIPYKEYIRNMRTKENEE